MDTSKNYYNLRINEEGDVLEALDTSTNEWFPCHNEFAEQDAEDIRQFRSILPNFINPYLKENYSL